MSYKDDWNERYCQMALEKYGCEYWECTPTQRNELDKAINNWTADYVAERIDAARERRKYEEK